MLTGEQDDVKPAGAAGQNSRTGLLLLLMIVMISGGLYYAYNQMHDKALRNESAQILTAQIMQFPATVSTGVARLQSEGVPLHKIDFSAQGTGNYAVFHKKGGAVRYQAPPAGLLEGGGRWLFKAVTEKGEGWFIAGLGSDDAAGKDVFAYLSGVPLAVCERLNRHLGLAPLPRVESIAVDFARPGDKDDRAGLNPWTFSAHGKPIDAEGQSGSPSAACVRNGADGEYVYYHLLAAQ
ncbi:MAG: hypothetical protein Q8K65_05305 [Alphaproteobacteria bacterium]|nr:hypothetical protein [Alphaproteobacteria bacterium]